MDIKESQRNLDKHNQNIYHTLINKFLRRNLISLEQKNKNDDNF